MDGSGDKKTFHVNLPNGSRVTLCGRDPRAAEVRGDLAKAAAVTTEYGMVVNCELHEAVAIYELVLNSLVKEAAQGLMERSREFYRTVNIHPTTENKPAAEKKSKGTTFH